MYEQCVDGPRPMRDRVLLGHRHLREGLRRPLRDEDRIEPESPGPALPVGDRTAAFSVEDLVLLRRPEEEDGLEPRGASPGTVQKLQDPGAPEALVYVRRIDPGEAAELLEEQYGAIDQVVATDLVVEDRRGEPDDLLEAVRLGLGIRGGRVDELAVGVRQLRRGRA